MNQITKEHPAYPKFLSLYGRMSPENLHCDGEISRAEAASRYRQITREWSALVKQIEIPVGVEDIESIICADYTR